MSERNENEQYKLIVIFSTALLLLFGCAAIYHYLRDFSKVVGFIASPVLLYLAYRVMKIIWPEL